MKRNVSGRCHRCNIRYVWQPPPLLRDAYCPRCSSKLQQTTHLGHQKVVIAEFILVRAN
jgi:uncharacterized paraquat-inducible protein A